MRTLMDTPVHYAIGEYYYRGRPALNGARLHGIPGANELLAKATEPKVVGFYAAGIALGGLLMALSEFGKGPKGHHSGMGRTGRILLGTSAAVAGTVFATAAWQMQSPI